MVVAYLQEFGTAERKDLDKLLLDKLSSTLSDEQKFNFITNLLQKMRREGVVRSGGPGRRGTWSLV
jgi:ATP-dependent DNA helicase RecG